MIAKRNNIYKFLGVLNSKKAKLRKLRDQLSKQDNTDKHPQEEEDADKTESFHEESDYDKSDEDEDPQTCITSSSKDVKGKQTVVTNYLH
ncbi:hypothetical protein RYX36_019243 [Vicia faba]